MPYILQLCHWLLLPVCRRAGVLQAWDRREPGRPSQQSGAAGHAMSCLAVHPAQPHLCASGSMGESGGILVWDLRQPGKPAVAVAVPGNGGVTDLHFDSGSDAAQLVFCTSGGLVGTARESGKVRARGRRVAVLGAQAGWGANSVSHLVAEGSSGLPLGLVLFGKGSAASQLAHG